MGRFGFIMAVEVGNEVVVRGEEGGANFSIGSQYGHGCIFES